MNEKQQEQRLKDIIKIAYVLNWCYPTRMLKGASYPLMQLSEVEKCMLAMTDDFELKRMKQWYKDTTGNDFELSRGIEREAIAASRSSEMGKSQTCNHLPIVKGNEIGKCNVCDNAAKAARKGGKA